MNITKTIIILVIVSFTGVSCSYMTLEGLEEMFSAKAITSFSFSTSDNPSLLTTSEGTISGNTIYITVPYGTDLSSLKPSISVVGKSINPCSGSACSFFDNRVYAVTAEDDTTRSYVVKVTAAPGDAKNILSFVFLRNSNLADLSTDYTCTVGANTATVTVPFNTDITDLAPTIAISGASISPASGTALDFTGGQTYRVTALDGTTKDYTVSVTVAPSDAKDILSFDFTQAANSAYLSSDVTGDISGTTITLTVPYGTGLTDLTPTIAISGTSFDLISGDPGNFSSDKVYTVTAADGTTKSYTVKTVIAPNTEKDILIFGFTQAGNPAYLNADVSGDIVAGTVTVTVPYDTDITDLKPFISFSEQATVNPDITTALDFTTDQTYIVTAEDTSTKEYTVTVNIGPNTACSIDTAVLYQADNAAYLAADITGSIGDTTADFIVPYGIERNDLKPVFTLSTGATISPNSGDTQDFSSGGVTYTVTAEDGTTTKTYDVTVSYAPNTEKDILSFSFLALHNPAPIVDVTGDITANTISITVPAGTDVTNLTPTISLSDNASVLSLAADPNDFSSDQTFVVTAEDDTTKEYTVSVTVSTDAGGPGLPESNLIATAATQSSITLSWTEATDDITEAANLRYKVVRSATPITTIEEAEAPGCYVYQEWVPNITTYTAHSMNIDTYFYFNVIVKDEAGNKTLYNQLYEKTLRDFSNNLAALYTFNSNSSDTSSNANHLTLTSAANLTYGANRATPPIDVAMHFDSGNDHLWAANPASLNLTDEMTISLWINFSNVSTDQKILGKSNSGASPNNGYIVAIRNGKYFCETWDSGGIYYSLDVDGINTPITAGNWIHLGLTWKKNGKMRAYIGGQFIAEIDTGINPLGTNTSNFVLGTAPWNTGAFPIINGSLDDIRIYSVELSTLEMEHLAEKAPD